MRYSEFKHLQAYSEEKKMNHRWEDWNPGPLSRGTNVLPRHREDMTCHHISNICDVIYIYGEAVRGGRVIGDLAHLALFFLNNSQHS